MSTFGAASVSSLFGGLVATYLGWRWAFLLAVPFIFCTYFVPIVAGLVMFSMPGIVRRFQYLVALFDAAGLALFAASGANKALAFDINPVSAALLGMLTGIGGSRYAIILCSA